MKTTKFLAILVLALGLILCQARVSQAINEHWKKEKVYHSSANMMLLYDANRVADGLYDLQIKLYDDPNVILGNQVGSTIDINDLDIVDGYFRVELDTLKLDWFGALGQTPMGAPSLEISVRPGDSNDPCDFVTLSPRQQIKAVPYALHTRGIYVDEDYNVGIRTMNPQGLLQVGEECFIVKIDTLSGCQLVGIDELDPQALLEITRCGSRDLLMLSSTAAEDGDLLIVKNDGKVGIGTTSPGDYKLYVNGEKAGIYSVATVAEMAPRPFAVVADLDISSGYAHHGGGFKATVNTSRVPAAMIPYVFGGYFRMEDDGGTGLSQCLRGVAVELLDTQQDDYGLELKCDDPSYTIYSPGTGKVYFEGNVGIGTTSPTEKLDVDGRARIRDLPEFDFNDVVVADSEGVLYKRDIGGLGGADDDWYEVGTGSPPGSINDDIYTHGKVGIGTTSPEEKLDVRGDIILGGSTGPGGPVSKLWFRNDAGNIEGRITQEQNAWTFEGSNTINFIAGTLGYVTVNPYLSVAKRIYNSNMAEGTGTPVFLNSYGFLVKQVSSSRYKENIRKLEVDPEKVLQLEPAKFSWKTTGQEDIGLIAEDVQEALKDLVIYDNEGRPDAVKYDKVALYLLEVVKTQQQRIAALEEAVAQNESLKQRLETLERMIQQQQLAVAKEVQQ